MSMTHTPTGHSAIILMIGHRYFHGFSKRRRLTTAWSLAGAKLFGTWDIQGIEKAERTLAAKGYVVTRCLVEANHGRS